MDKIKVQHFFEDYGSCNYQFGTSFCSLKDNDEYSEIYLYMDSDLKEQDLKTINNFANQNANLYKKLVIKNQNGICLEFDGNSDKNNIRKLLNKSTINSDFDIDKLNETIKEENEKKEEPLNIVTLKFNPRTLIDDILNVYKETLDEDVKIEVQISNNQKKKIRKKVLQIQNNFEKQLDLDRVNKLIDYSNENFGTHINKNKVTVSMLHNQINVFISSDDMCHLEKILKHYERNEMKYKTSHYFINFEFECDEDSDDETDETLDEVINNEETDSDNVETLNETDETINENNEKTSDEKTSDDETLNDETSNNEKTSDEKTSDDETSDDKTSNNENSDDETLNNETSNNEISDEEISDEITTDKITDYEISNEIKNNENIDLDKTTNLDKITNKIENEKTKDDETEDKEVNDKEANNEETENEETDEDNFKLFLEKTKDRINELSSEDEILKDNIVCDFSLHEKNKLDVTFYDYNAFYYFGEKYFNSNKLFEDDIMNEIFKQCKNDILNFSEKNIEKLFLEDILESTFDFVKPNDNDAEIVLNYDLNDNNRLLLNYNNATILKNNQNKIINGLKDRLINFHINDIIITDLFTYDEKDIFGTIKKMKQKEEDLNKAKLIFGYSTDLGKLNSFGINDDFLSVFPLNEINNNVKCKNKKQNWFKCKFIKAQNIEEFTAKKTGKEFIRGNILLKDSKDNFINCRLFSSKNQKSEEFVETIKKLNKYSNILVNLELSFDDFSKNNNLNLKTMYLLNEEEFIDNSGKTNRYELSTFTKMSTLGAISNPEDLIKQSAKIGLSGLAFTDITSTQGFTPLIHSKDKYNNFKPIYGTTFRMMPDKIDFVYNPIEKDIYNLDNKDIVYVAFDVETTGFSIRYNKIIELSFVKFKIDENGEYQEIKGLTQVINIHEDIPQEIKDLTGIQQEDIQNGIELKDALMTFKNEIKDCILVGQNVKFDIDFINKNLIDNNVSVIDNQVIDTLPIARKYITAKSYNLTALSKKLGVKLEGAHRAINDSRATGKVMVELLKIVLEAENKEKINGLELNKLGDYDESYKNGFDYEIHVLAQNMKGIKNIYELISKASTEYLVTVFTTVVERLKEKDLIEKHENILIGSGSVNTYLWKLIHEKDYQQAKDYAEKLKLDYIEISPFNTFGLNESEFDNYKESVKLLIKLSHELNIPAIVVSSSHYTLKEERIGYDALYFKVNGRMLKNNQQYYLKTPKELEQDFNFLDDNTKQEIIYDNTEKIADKLDGDMKPVITDVFAPKIENSEEIVRNTVISKAKELYGDPIPEEIEERINTELGFLIKGGYTVHYITAKKIVDYSESLGYLVGSRGSVGSSIVAYLMGITEVNALKPHYRSKHGDYFEWGDIEKYKSGFDLPPKEDPNHPGEMLIRDGHNLPFATFLGLKGTKIPDIDLNFASEVQNKVQLELRNIFGKEHTVRVGTISTLAEKTSVAVAFDYSRNINKELTNGDISFIADLIEGTKSTTGQHPAGILIVPNDKDITDFTPYTYPANKKYKDKIAEQEKQENWTITHFTMEDMHDSLLKMDVLAHQDPSVLHLLEKITGVNPKTIDPTDPKIMALFTKADVDGVPEFNTNFAKGILKTTKPTRFSHLVQISGLSHGTNVWTGNAEDLITKQGKTLDEVIGSRDKITQDMLQHGLSAEDADRITLLVKKCKPFTDNDIKLLKDHNVEDWYIESLQKIRYMYPAAHAIAYVLSAVRIAYYKVYYPEAFHAAIINFRYDDCFDSDLMIDSSVETIQDKIIKCESIVKNKGKYIYQVDYKYNVFLNNKTDKAKIEYHKSKTKTKGVFIWKKFTSNSKYTKFIGSINNNSSLSNICNAEIVEEHSKNTYEKKLSFYKYILNAIKKDNIKFAKPSIINAEINEFKLNDNNEIIVPLSFYNNIGEKSAKTFYNFLHNTDEEELNETIVATKTSELSKLSKKSGLTKKSIIELVKYNLAKVDDTNKLVKLKIDLK